MQFYQLKYTQHSELKTGKTSKEKQQIESRNFYIVHRSVLSAREKRAATVVDGIPVSYGIPGQSLVMEHPAVFWFRGNDVPGCLGHVVCH